MEEPDDLDVDFDFKSMLSHIDDPNTFGVDMLSPPPPSGLHRGSAAPPLHPNSSRQHQALSMGEMLDSKLFKPDAPWSIGGNRQGLTAAPPPSTFNGAVRNNRSNSGAVISTRLRAASDMFQQGFLTSEEKSLMKDLILSRNPKFKEEYANAERTNNWFNLQQFLRTFRRSSPANSLSMAIDDLTTEFEALATPPPPMPHQHFGDMLADASAAAMSKSVRKRMASQSTPVARPKKTTSNTKKAVDPVLAMAATNNKMRTTNLEEQEKMHEEDEAAPVMTTKSVSSAAKADPGTPSPTSSPPPPSSTMSLRDKPIAQMDDKELEIEAAIAAADGDSEAVAKIRKNERERRRRLAVSNGFDELFELLKLPQAAQIDKVSILRKAIDRIRELEARVRELEDPKAETKSSRSAPMETA